MPTRKETMTGISQSFFLFSIIIRPSTCQGSVEKSNAKDDLIIAMLSVFLLLTVLLILSCSFIHYKLMTKDITLKKELKSFAIQTHKVETRILLSPAQAMKLAACPGAASLLRAPPVRKLPSPLPIKPKPSKVSISRMHRTRSSESIRSKESGSVYSMEEFDYLYGSTRSTSRESIDNKGALIEEEPSRSNDSGSTVFCDVHQM